MVARLPCPDWEYKQVGDHQAVLRTELATILRALRTAEVSIEVEGVDTRPVHYQLFNRLTPPGHPYFAGHYRGENFPCLANYAVGVPADPMVGIPSSQVQVAMAQFGQDLLTAAAVLDVFFTQPDAQATQEEKLYSAVVIAARAFQEVLTIHPYANGNGHMARFLVWLLLGRYGYWPSKWTIDPRPNVASYSAAISSHRREHPAPLERMILQSIL